MSDALVRHQASLVVARVPRFNARTVGKVCGKDGVRDVVDDRDRARVVAFDDVIVARARVACPSACQHTTSAGCRLLGCRSSALSRPIGVLERTLQAALQYSACSSSTHRRTGHRTQDRATVRARKHQPFRCTKRFPSNALNRSMPCGPTQWHRSTPLPTGMTVRGWTRARRSAEGMCTM